MTYFFFDCPTHKYKLRFHTHTAATFCTCKRWLESKNDTSTFPSNYKAPSQENLAKKSTIITNPSNSATTTSEISYALTEVPDVNALMGEALDLLGYNQISWDLTSDALNVIN